MVDKTSTSEHSEIDFGQALHEATAKSVIQAILDEGEVAYSKHAKEEMEKDRLTTVDVVNVLRGGSVGPPEWENGSWRYRVQTQKMCVVVALRSKSELKIVTAWKERRGRI